MLLALVLAPGWAAGQQASGTVQGRVTTLNSQGQAIALGGVDIKLTGNSAGLPSRTSSSDALGEYKFQNLPPGSYSLEASLEGFSSITAKVTLGPGATVTRDFRLQIAEVRQNVVVRETAPIISPQGTAPPTQKLSTRQLLSIPVVNQKFKEELPVTPGVVQIHNGKLYIKGVSEGQSVLLIDGARAVDPVTGSFSIDVPLDAIQTLDVYKAPFSVQYGGFVGGMTGIELKQAPNEWHLTMNDLNPSIRGKAGHIVGFARAEPRIRFGGPLWKNKINFSESFLYELRKQNVRGLAWPNDETKIQGFNSITNFEFILTPQHLFSLTVNAFPRRQEWANLNALIPRPATSDFGQSGYSVDGADTYQFGSKAILHSFFKYTSIDSNAHGHGPLDMLVSPEGYGGDYFNAWTRSAQQEEGQTMYSLPSKNWLGKHEISVGAYSVHRIYTGISASHPVLLLREDGSAAERIAFSGAGQLAASDTEYGAFTQDHWIMNKRLALTLGLRYLGQSNGEKTDFAPRAGLVYALDKSDRTVLRAGVGVFHDRTPLLGADFADNPTRTITPLDLSGNPAAPSLTYQNVCSIATEGGLQILPRCSDLGSTPRNLTWRLQVSHRLTHHLTASASFLNSDTFKVFVIDPVVQSPGDAMLMLSNRGASKYREYEVTVDYRPNAHTSLSLAYVHSKSLGDLNTLDNLLVPFEEPVIRPDVYAYLPSDIRDRLTGFGMFRLPWSMTLSPSIDLHSGFPYSNVDVLQNYVGTPNGQRYPLFLSLNWRIYRDFPLPFNIHRGHKFRLGIYSVDTTSHLNPTAVYNNVTSPLFGQFAGFGKRINGIVIEFAH